MRWSPAQLVERHDHMAKPEYSVLIRTFNSEATLPDTLGYLANQSARPSQYVFVDSGSCDRTLALFPSGSTVHKYIGKDFNYSDALNQGLEYVSSEYVLIISSHTFLTDPEAVKFAITILEENERFGAAYFCHERDRPLRYASIDKENFDGSNGLWNTCSLIRLDVLKRRKFRPEVFSAEDQEWASWLISSEGRAVARISGAGAINGNPLVHSLRKLRNEYVSIAYFIDRSRLRWSNILRIVASAVEPAGGRRLRHRVSQLLLAGRLVAARFSKPTTRSRYF